MLERAADRRRCVIPPMFARARASTPWNGIAPTELSFRVPAPPRWRPHESEEHDMSIFNKVTKTFQWGQQTVTLETGEIARQSGGAVVVDDRRHRRPRHRRRQEGRQARPGLLPADRRLHREDLRRRQDPGQLLQARRPPERARDADLAPDRPAAPAALPRRLLQRGAGRHPRAVAEPRGRRPTSRR